MRIHQRKYLIVWTLLLSSLLVSCSKEELYGEMNQDTNQIVKFGIVDNLLNQDQTKVTNERNKNIDARLHILKTDDLCDTLYMKVTTTDDFESAMLPNNLTRATPIKDLSEYNKFGVFAYWKRTDVEGTDFFMYNEEVKNKSIGTKNQWSTDNVYWWPGAKHKLQFIGYAPFNDPSIVIPANTSNPTYDIIYTVPNDVKQQKDIVVAKTNEIDGNFNQSIPLSFKHICTAVKFSTGKAMQAGKITSIVIKGVYSKGTYSMSNSTWNIDTKLKKDYIININKDFDGTPLSEITIADNTLMMVPQTLPEGASVEVTFVEKANGNTRVLKAPINGDIWTMGKTVNYTISITPSYDIHFNQTPEPQDAHYVMYPIKFHVDNTFTGGWEIVSDNPNLTLQTSLTKLQLDGYWIEEDKGTQRITGTNKGEITVYAFLTENRGKADRKLTLTLTPTGITGAISKKFEIIQYCPLWNQNGFGAERIEEKGANWGFNWDRVVTYTKQGLGTAIFAGLTDIIIWWNSAEEYVTKTYQFGSQLKIVIDYRKLNNLVDDQGVPQGISPNDGLGNTLALFTYKNVGENTHLEDVFNSWPMNVQVTGTSADIAHQNYAVKEAIKKNMFHKKTETTKAENGTTITVEIPYINAKTDLVWYLPAIDQYQYIVDPLYPLNGIYWTSTSGGNDNVNSYIYDATTKASVLEPRNKTHKIRAIRVNPY